MMMMLGEFMKATYPIQQLDKGGKVFLCEDGVKQMMRYIDIIYTYGQLPSTRAADLLMSKKIVR